MWVEKTKNGYRLVERYKEPVTGKYRKASVSMSKNTASTRKVAERIMRQKIISLTSEIDKNVTMQELINLWIASAKERLKESTVNTYTNKGKAVLKVVPADVLVNNLTSGFIKKNLAKIARTSEKNTIINNIRTIIRWGYEKDLVNDISWLEKLKPEHDQEKDEKLSQKYLESSELIVLLDSINKQKYHDLTAFLALTGVRIGEALAIEYTDINIDKRVVSISKTFNPNLKVNLTPKSLASSREIYIQNELMALCKKLYQQASANRFVSTLIFPDCIYTSYRAYLIRHSEKYVNKTITPHGLRHTHVALLAEQGLSLDVISRRLGHKNSTITRKIYFHVTEKLKQKDYKAIEQIVIM